MSGIEWAFGEVVGTEHTYNQTTGAEKKKKRDKEGKAVGEDLADPKYRGEIEVTMGGQQGGTGGGMAGDTITAYPSDLNYTRIPLIGEHVVMYSGPGANMGSSPPDTKSGKKNAGITFDTEWFYLPPITIRGQVELNQNPGANAGGTKGGTQTNSDGTQTSKTDAYSDAEQGNPTVGNKKPDNSGNQTINTFPDYKKGELSDADIAEFQELEQKILDLNDPESPLYKSVFNDGEAPSIFEGRGAVKEQARIDEMIEEAENDINELKEDLLYCDEEGDPCFQGKFLEASGDIDTITGYLNMVPEQEKAKKEKEKAKDAEIKGRDDHKNTSNETGGGDQAQNKTTSPPGKDFVEKGNRGNLQPYEGDTLIQGRHGQSIRFGSQVEAKDPEKYVQPQPWTAGTAPEGSPIMIIRNGQAFDGGGGNANNFIVEDINGDKASVWLSSGQNVPIQVASPVFDAIDASIGGGGTDSPTYYDSNGNPVPSNDCNGVSGPIHKAPDMDPMPSDCAELPRIDMEVEYFDTRKGSKTRGKVVGTDYLRIIDNQPVLEQFSCIVLQIFQAAAADGVMLKLNSSFRGIHQINHPTTGRKLASGQLNCRYAMSIDRSWRTEANKKDRSSPLWKAKSTKFKPYVAIPGYSRHQSGTAIDLNYKEYRDTNHDKNTEVTPPRWKRTSTSDTDGVYAWLIGNTYKFGFIRTVTTEEWHFEYDPERAKHGPFGKLKTGSSNRWHGLDSAYQKGILGPNRNNTWNTKKEMLPAGHPWSDDPQPPPTDNWAVGGGDSVVSDVAQGYLEVMSFGLLGDDDGKLG